MRRNLGIAVVATALALGLWQAIVSVTGVDWFILPDPARVGRTIWEQRVLIAENAAITIFEVLAGFVLGGLAGAAAALVLAWSDIARTYLRPILVFTQAVPVFALAPVLTLWFGYGIGPKIAVTLLIVYFPVASALLDGLMNTPAGYLDLGRAMGASRARTLWLIRLPAAVPELTTGLRLAAVYAPIAAFIGEWVGSSRGLGYLMLLANGRGKTDLMFAALFVLAAFTVLFHFLVDRAGRALTRRFS